MAKKYNFDELLEKEKENFKKNWIKAPDLKNLDEGNVKKVLKMALNATLNHKVAHQVSDEEFYDPFVKEYINFATNNINDKNDFEKEFERFIENYQIRIKKCGVQKADNFGYAQKFVSLSFKLIYCFNDKKIKESNFQYCKMIIDKYTLNWYFTIGEEETKAKFMKNNKNKAWSKIEKENYETIQKEIEEYIENKGLYQVECWENGEKIELSGNVFESEFIIWEQEQLNEIYKKLKKKSHNIERIVKYKLFKFCDTNDIIKIWKTRKQV